MVTALLKFLHNTYFTHTHTHTHTKKKKKKKKKNLKIHKSPFAILNVESFCNNQHTARLLPHFDVKAAHNTTYTLPPNLRSDNIHLYFPSTLHTSKHPALSVRRLKYIL